MILKKPYAFLIKYFKLINFVVFILAIYIAYKTYNIISFFNEYITNNYTGNYYPDFYKSYVSPFTYLILITMLLCIIGIYLLFIYKKKPTKVYITSIIYYISFFVFLFFIKNIMITLENSLITAETARIYRDLSILFFFPQIYLIIMYLLRGLGLNIKKFNFDQDLKNLKIEEQDNEEVEITLKNNNVKLIRNIKRFFREFKYYVKENKFIFSIIFIILIVLSGYLIYNSFPEIIDKEYIQGETFVINNLNYKIEDSIITNLNYNGDVIKDNKYYLVVRLSVENKSNASIPIDYNNFRLEINDNYSYPLLDKGQNFIDYAKDNYSKEIKANTSGIYSIIYEIKEKELRKSYEIKIANGSTISDNLIVGRHNYIKISPIVINKVNTEITVNQNEEINFSNSNLGNTKITLSNAEITNKYVYDYESCVNNICNTYKDIININNNSNNKTLIIMDYKYEFDYDVPFFTHSTTFNTLISTFMKLKYKNDENKFVYEKIENVTPTKLKKKIAIETTNKINNSSEVYLSFVIRNKEYLISLK